MKAQKEDGGGTQCLPEPPEEKEQLFLVEDEEISAEGQDSCEAYEEESPDSLADCPICLDKLVEGNSELARVQPCGHRYHQFCIQAWAEKANTCPQCRVRFNTIEIVTGDTVAEKIHIDNKEYPKESGIAQVEVPEEPALPAFHHQHLQHQMCCLCDTSNDSPFAICSECSSGYHLSCVGTTDLSCYACPVCESSQTMESVVESETQRQRRTVRQLRQQIRRTRRRLGLALPRCNTAACSTAGPCVQDDDGVDYVSIVDHNKERELERERQVNGVPHETPTDENLAWRMLDSLQHSGAPTEGSTRHATPERTERKLKRPKHRRREPQEPARLTEEALQKHDHETPVVTMTTTTTNSSHTLSYNQKMLVQRLLLKPKLKRMHLPTIVYTRTNREVSRRLYREICSRADVVYWLNALEETAEREGIDLRNKVQVDGLLNEDERHSAFRKDFDPLVGKLISEQLKAVRGAVAEAVKQPAEAREGVVRQAQEL